MGIYQSASVHTFASGVHTQSGNIELNATNQVFKMYWKIRLAKLHMKYNSQSKISQDIVFYEDNNQFVSDHV